MKKITIYGIVLLTMFTILVAPTTGGITDKVSAQVISNELENGVYDVDHTIQFLNPYDNTTKVDGTVPSEMSATAGNNTMNRVMNQNVIFEKKDSGIFVTLTLATKLNVSGFNVEDLEIFVEDAKDANTYTMVPYTVGATLLIEGQEYEEYTFQVNSLDLIISPRFKFMSPSGFYMVLGDTQIKAVINKTALNDKLVEAKAIVGSEYTEESFAQLQTAIHNAQAVLDNEAALQTEVNEQVTQLNNSLALLVKKAVESEDGIYEVPVALWHATEDRPSMVATSLNTKARIIKKDGIETMYIYTLEGDAGYIPGFQIDKLTRALVDMSVMTSDANGNPTSFSFPLENHNEYLAIKVLTSAETKQGMPARLKFDYTQLTKISTDVNMNMAVAPAFTPTSTNTGVNTSDVTNGQNLLLVAMVSFVVLGAFVYKKKVEGNV